MIKIPEEQIDFFRYRNMLFNLYSQFLQYREMIKENGGSDPEGWEMDKELDTAIRLEDWIVEYMPSVRAVNVLKSLGCYTLMDVVQLSEKTLKETPACGKKTLNEIISACFEMGRAKTGALIVIQAESPLEEYERTGITVDGIVTSQLLVNIFEHNTPLHDGAVIIRGDRVQSATCYLPLSDNRSLSKDLGTRHRAGVGISEVTDALVIIVSEETCKVSVAQNGELFRCLDVIDLRRKLERIQDKKEGKPKRLGKNKGEGKKDEAKTDSQS